MKLKITLLAFLLVFVVFFVGAKSYYESPFLTYTVDLKKQDLKLFWKDEKGKRFGSIENLKLWIEKKNLKLDFAMNAGMYKTDNSPQGLYIEKQKTLSPLDTIKAAGNFYLKPNGVFYITTSNIAKICTTEMFRPNEKIAYATQSGPMLVINEQIHPDFKEGSVNLNVRNGVGILPDGKVVFVLSKKEINFYDFASYFKGLGCKNALYLDGFVSRAYLPSGNWIQTDGNFGALFAVTRK
ncbi:phosphodiester glycosidase family protein [Flavobacterium chilense]|uniref:Uncharacterized protein YigE, DUF2233 family n=1 Tax=Flavobacterium chilense TaxID=946677 RepID=A0A1M6Z2A5_9FLAO|nr:phosphodiester glycosidase family protein [Flavobacterium chilense]SHL24513.1 Uncharacterized protein YigE, DUF2233 family [Flavobacterium chilense]